MKVCTPILFLFMIMASCESNPGGKNKIQQHNAKEGQAIPPHFVSTSPTGYYLTAKINGKEWAAEAMMINTNNTNPRIQGEKDSVMMGFYLWLPGIKKGSIINFSMYNAADFQTGSEIGIWRGTQGEITIKKIDEHVIEGTFYFMATAPSTEKTIAITSGYFRLPQAPLDTL